MTASEYERWCDLADRAAVGEVLTAEDRDFLRDYALGDPVCQAELSVWRHMSDLTAPAEDLRARGIAKRVLERTIGQKASPARAKPTKHRIGLWVGAGGAVAAAAAAVFLVATRPTSERVASSSSPAASVVYVEGSVRAGGRAVHTGARLSPGTTLAVGEGVACVRTEPKITVCLGERSKLRLSELGVADRRLDLVSGRVAAALDPLREKGRFSIVADGTWVTAVGTAFSVAFVEGGIESRVYEGKVTVGGRDGGELVKAYQLGLTTDRGLALDAIEGAPTTSEWRALERVTGRRFEAPAGEAPSGKTAQAPSQEADRTQGEVALEDHPAGSSRTHTSPVQPPRRAPAPLASAEDMLKEARGLLREKHWSEAAATYRRLIATHPSDPAAHTVLVSLGQLELDRLGDARSALGRFESYLKAGGPLEMEARLGRVRALRAMGARERERRAIEDFLAAYPDSLHDDQLKGRLQELSR